MGDDKKQTEEKRYAILSKDSIKAYAESTGHSDISDEVAALLAEDVVYRVREATMNGCQFMRHSKRRKLTTEDFNKGLRNSDIQPLLGFSQPSKLPFRHTREADLFFVEETDVELGPACLKTQPVSQPGTTTVNAQWLALEGIQKSAALGSGLSGKNIPKAVPTVSDDLLAYYDNMTKAILGNDEQVMKCAFNDLRSNSKIASLLPYFVNFVNNGVKTVSHDISQLIKLLHTVKALVSNQSLYLEPKPYLELLVQTVLYCLLEPLAASINPLNDHWAVRDYAARLLAQITGEWTTPVNQLRKNNLSSLQETFRDLGRPFCSHYGAVIGLITFGTKAVERLLLPHLPRYWQHLTTALDDPACTSIDPHKVHGVILLAMEQLINERGLQLLHPEKEPSGDQEDESLDELRATTNSAHAHVQTTAPIPTGAPGAGGDSASEVAPSVPLTGGIHFSHLDLIGPVIELPDSKEGGGGAGGAGGGGGGGSGLTGVGAAAVALTSAGVSHDQGPELIGKLLSLPEVSGAGGVSGGGGGDASNGLQVPMDLPMSLAELYKQVAEYFGDSLAARLPVRYLPELGARHRPEPEVSLADPENQKSGEELLQVFLNVSSRLDESMEPVEVKSENQSLEPTPDDVDDEKSINSSERSFDSAPGDYIDGGNLTVKEVVDDPSTGGIKLRFRMLPKNDPPAPIPAPVAPPEPEPEPVIKVRRKYLDEEVFEREPLLPPPLPVFVFSYAGCVQESQPKPWKPHTIFDDSSRQWSGELLAIATKQYGRRKTCSLAKASHRRHQHTATLYSVL